MNSADRNPGARAVGNAISGLMEAPAQMAAAFASALTKRGLRGCEIPPPCWEPRRAGVCCLDLPPGCAGTIRVHILNCDWSRRVMAVTALGKIAAWLKIEPTTLVLGPQERATVLVTVRVPDSVKPGVSLSGPLIIHGCNDHFVRIDVRVAECSGCMTCDVFVDDCPDHIHHWYDHFYCPRPCRGQTTRDPRDG